MEYRRYADAYLVRFDKGDEIMEQLALLTKKEGIRLAAVSALGATDDFTVGVFDPKAKQYRPCRFTGDHEIVCLTGTVTEKDGAPYLHLHMSAGGLDGRVVGGHLTRAVVSLTCEMTLRLLPGKAGRVFNEDLGINLIEF